MPLFSQELLSRKPKTSANDPVSSRKRRSNVCIQLIVYSICNAFIEQINLDFYNYMPYNVLCIIEATQ